jgi:hypothetical protein
MRRLLATLLLAAALVGAVPRPAQAGSTAANVALGLAAFAVFSGILAAGLHPVYAAPPVVVHAPPPVYPAPVYASPVYAAPLAAHAGPPVVLRPPAPRPPAIVDYPHGRWELRGDGLSVAYHWVWIPKPPPPPR